MEAHYFVAMYYGTGSHKLYCELMNNKSAVSTTKTLKNFLKYIS